MADKKTQVVVIGAGPGGYVCAIRLAQLGKKVTVIEKGNVGGVCLNVGCIPSKALIHAGHIYQKMTKHVGEMGLELTGGVKVNLPKLIKWKESVVQKLTGGVGQLLKANGCEVIQAEAKFTSPTTLKAGGDTISFEQCVIATGSRPTEIPGFKVDQKDVLDSTGALAQTKVPKSMLCVGGGYIGLELGFFYAKIGTKIDVVEASPSLLGVVDPELVRVVEKSLKAHGAGVILNTAVKGMKKTKTGLEVTFSDGKSKTYEKILMTVGRRPNSDNLDLDKAGLRPDEKGFLRIDKQMRTDIPNIYAIGDVAGQPMLAHKGSKEGMVAAEVIAGKRSMYDVVAVPAVVFTDPEVATAGMSEAEAKKAGHDVLVGRFPFAANGRALSLMESDGFIKIIGEKKTNKLLGVHIVGPEASTLIAEATLALEMGAAVDDIALTIHAHPTLPETMMEAAEATLGHAIHIYQRKRPSAQPQATA